MSILEIAVVFHSILLISALIGLGAIAARTYKFNNDTKKMYISLITNVGMPSIILSSIFNVTVNRETLKLLFVIFLVSIGINLLGLALGYITTLLFKKRFKKSIEVTILSAFGNTGFIGIPLCAVLFGAEGALYAAVFDAGVDFTIWTVGVYLMQQDKRFNKSFLKDIINIPLLAIIFGLVIAGSGLQVPIIIADFTSMIADFAVPLAMFYIGAILINFQKGYINVPFIDITVPILIKLIILPLIVSVIFINSNLDEMIIYILIIQSMMPALTLSSVLFSKYSRDDNFGAFITILSTVFSLFIIPGFIKLIDVFY